MILYLHCIKKDGLTKPTVLPLRRTRHHMKQGTQTRMSKVTRFQGRCCTLELLNQLHRYKIVSVVESGYHPRMYESKSTKESTNPNFLQKNEKYDLLTQVKFYLSYARQ